MSGIYHLKVPGDATGYLDISHQHFSAGATGSGSVQHQGHNGPGLSQTYGSGKNLDPLPGKCANVMTTQCAPDCTKIDPITGCVICNTACSLGGNIGSGVTGNTKTPSSGTPTRQTQAPTSSVATQSSTPSQMCPSFPGNCPRGSVSLVNGCPICTATVTQAPPTTTTVSPTCPPVKCIAPCNKGIMLGATGCPQCVC